MKQHRAKQHVAKMVTVSVLFLSLGWPSPPIRSETNAERRLEQFRREAKEEESQETSWRESLQGLIAKKAAAEEEFVRVTEQYTRARRLKRHRGGSSTEEAAAVSKARAALDAAQTELEAFYEKARLAGVPPGWIRSED